MLRIEDLHVRVDGHSILNGLNLDVAAGEVHAIMGPNGSGKSTLAQVIAGREQFEVSAGSVTYAGQALLALAPPARACPAPFPPLHHPTPHLRGRL